MVVCWRISNGDNFSFDLKTLCHVTVLAQITFVCIIAKLSIMKFITYFQHFGFIDESPVASLHNEY